MKFFQTKSQLYRYRADENWHFSAFSYFYIMKTFGLTELEGSEKKSPLLLNAKTIIEAKMRSYNRMIPGFLCQEVLVLILYLYPGDPIGYRLLQDDNTNYNCKYE